MHTYIHTKIGLHVLYTHTHMHVYVYVIMHVWKFIFTLIQPKKDKKTQRIDIYVKFYFGNNIAYILFPLIFSPIHYIYLVANQ